MTTFAQAVALARDRIEGMFETVIADLQAFPDPQQTYPYSDLYINFVVSQLPDARTVALGANKFRHPVTFRARLIAGKATQGYSGALAQQVAYTYIPQIIAYFYQRRNLVYAAGQAKIDHLTWQEFSMSSGGFATWQTEEDGDQFYAGAEFLIGLAFEFEYRLEYG